MPFYKSILFNQNLANRVVFDWSLANIINFSLNNANNAILYRFIVKSFVGMLSFAAKFCLVVPFYTSILFNQNLANSIVFNWSLANSINFSLNIANIAILNRSIVKRFVFILSFASAILY